MPRGKVYNTTFIKSNKDSTDIYMAVSVSCRSTRAVSDYAPTCHCPR